MRFLNYFLAFLIGSLGLMAQKYGDVRGFVYDAESGEPMMFTPVLLEGTTFGGSTDVNGFYSINKIPVGTYNLLSSSVGYDTIRLAIQVEAGQIINQKLQLQKKSVELGSVEISSKREEARTEVRTSMVKITPKQINRIPAIGGEPDLAQYLQVLPGVTFTGDQGGQLYIRGGAPIQTRVLLDGLTVYNPFHSIGLFSVFDTDIIRNVEVYTGGFNAYYGGRVSAVVDVVSKDGNKKEHRGKVSVGPFLAKAQLEGPLMRAKDGGSAITYILSYKNSYLDKTSPKLYPYVNEKQNAQITSLPYRFDDIFAKITVSADNGSKVSLFGFNFNDAVDYNNSAFFNWNSYGAGGNFVIVPGQTKTIIGGKLAYSKYNIELQEEGADKPRNSSIGGFDFKLDNKYFLPKGMLQYGFDLSGFSTEYYFYNSLGIKNEQNQNTTEIGSFFVYRTTAGRWIIEPSVRFTYYASLTNGQIEPRLGLKYNASERLRFKFAAGRYTQNFISTKSDRDVVNLFTGFLSAPEEGITDRNGNDASSSLQTAFHYIGGVEIDVNKNFELNIEPYYKDFTQLVNINRAKLFNSDPDFIVETGNAYGIDFLGKFEKNRWYLWLTYSLGYIKRQDGDLNYYPHFDRRHNANVVSSYTMGRRKDWELSARWNLGSGFPFTKTQGFYEEVDFSDGISTDYISQNGNVGIIYEDKFNAGRLPYYHRLDLALKKRFNLSERSTLEATFSLTNTYNRDNIFYVNRLTLEKIYQLPILPALNVAWNF